MFVVVSPFLGSFYFFILCFDFLRQKTFGAYIIKLNNKFAKQEFLFFFFLLFFFAFIKKDLKILKKTNSIPKKKTRKIANIFFDRLFRSFLFKKKPNEKI